MTPTTAQPIINQLHKSTKPLLVATLPSLSTYQQKHMILPNPIFERYGSRQCMLFYMLFMSLLDCMSKSSHSRRGTHDASVRLLITNLVSIKNDTRVLTRAATRRNWTPKYGEPEGNFLQIFLFDMAQGLKARRTDYVKLNFCSYLLSGS
jgi:hypothetical protein